MNLVLYPNIKDIGKEFSINLSRYKHSTMNSRKSKLLWEMIKDWLIVWLTNSKTLKDPEYLLSVVCWNTKCLFWKKLLLELMIWVLKMPILLPRSDSPLPTTDSRSPLWVPQTTRSANLWSNSENWLFKMTLTTRNFSTTPISKTINTKLLVPCGSDTWKYPIKLPLESILIAVSASKWVETKTSSVCNNNTTVYYKCIKWWKLPEKDVWPDLKEINCLPLLQLMET